MKMNNKIQSIIKKYQNMSKREKRHQIYSNLWVTPIIYAGIALMLFVITVWADLKMDFGEMMPFVFSASFQLTSTFLSTLTAGLLSLTSFTFYGVLTALTTFASQFLPRILKNFMMTRGTQRTIGIFIGSLLFPDERNSIYRFSHPFTFRQKKTRSELYPDLVYTTVLIRRILIIFIFLTFLFFTILEPQQVTINNFVRIAKFCFGFFF